MYPMTSFGGRGPAAQHALQVVPFEILHHDVRAALMHVGIDGADHVGLVQEGDDFHLAEEAGDPRLVKRTVGQEHFEGNDPIHQAVPGLEDPAPRPLAEMIDQDIASEVKPLLPRQKPAGLELGESPIADELMGQGQRINRIRRCAIGSALPGISHRAAA